MNVCSHWARVMLVYLRVKIQTYSFESLRRQEQNYPPQACQVANFNLHPNFTNFLLLEEALTTLNFIFSLKRSMKGYSNYQTKIYAFSPLFYNHIYLLNLAVSTMVIIGGNLKCNVDKWEKYVFCLQTKWSNY